MRSFSDYRKQCIKESLNKFSARGSSQALFDILKINLTESAGLPELLSESIVDKTEFNVFRRDCLIHRNLAFENICNHAKYTFYDELMNEAENLAATQSTGSMANPASGSSFAKDLKAEIIRLVGKLKAAVQNVSSPIAQTEEEPEQNAPASGEAPDAAPTSASAPSGAASSGGNWPSMSGSNSQSGGSSGGNWPSMAGSSGHGGQGAQMNAPTSHGSGGFSSLRPKDGWLNGIGRSIGNPLKDIGRYLKKNWYGENRKLIESMLLEQDDAVSKLIDDFTKELLAWVDQRSPEIAADAGMPSPVQPAQPAQPVPGQIDPGVPNAMGDRAIGTAPTNQDFAVSGGKQELQQKGMDPDVVNNPNNAVQKAAEAGDQQAQQIVNHHYENLKAIPPEFGISASKNKHYQGGGLKIGEIHIDGVPATDFMIDKFDRSGNPIEKQPISGYPSLLAAMVRKVAAKLNPDVAELSKEMRSNSFPTKLFDFVKKQLGDYGDFPSGHGQSACTALLLTLGAKARGIKKTPPVAGENPAAAPPESPAAETPAIGDRAIGGAPTSDQQIVSEPSGPADQQMIGAGVPQETQENPHIDQAMDHLKDDSKKGADRISHVLLTRLGEDGLRKLIDNQTKAANPKVPFSDYWKHNIVPVLKNKIQELIDQDKAASTQHAPTDQSQTQDAANPAVDPNAQTQDAVPQEKPMSPLMARLKAKKDGLGGNKPTPSVQQPQTQEDPQEKFLDFKQEVLGSDDLQHLVSAWAKLAFELGGTPSEQEIADKASLPPDELKAELLSMKKKALGMDQPVGESFLQQIAEFNKLIKESRMVTPSKTMREKLGLLS